MSQLRYSNAFTKFTEALPEQGLLLELNSGPGYYSQLFHQNGYELLVAELEHSVQHFANAYAKETFTKPIMDLVLPFRSLIGIWAHQSFIGYEDADLYTILNHLVDWLEPGGLLSIAFPEGEGKKQIQVHSPLSQKKEYIIYRNPEKLALLLDQVGFSVIDAWREETRADQPLLQILCQA